MFGLENGMFGGKIPRMFGGKIPRMFGGKIPICDRKMKILELLNHSDCKVKIRKLTIASTRLLFTFGRRDHEQTNSADEMRPQIGSQREYTPGVSHPTRQTTDSYGRFGQNFLTLLGTIPLSFSIGCPPLKIHSFRM